MQYRASSFGKQILVVVADDDDDDDDDDDEDEEEEDASGSDVPSAQVSAFEVPWTFGWDYEMERPFRSTTKPKLKPDRCGSPAAVQSFKTEHGCS